MLTQDKVEIFIILRKINKFRFIFRSRLLRLFREVDQIYEKQSKN